MQKIELARVDTERCRTGGSQRRSCTTRFRLALAWEVGRLKPTPSNPNAGFADLRRWILLGVIKTGSRLVAGRLGRP